MRILVLSILLSSLMGACGDFENPSIVLDMRVLGAIAEPPEVLVPEEPTEADRSSRFEAAIVFDDRLSQECPRAL